MLDRDEVRTGSVMRSLRVVSQRRRCPPYRSVAAGLDRTKSSSAVADRCCGPPGRRSPRPVGRCGRSVACVAWEYQSIDAMAKPLRAFGIGMLANEQSSSATVRRFARQLSLLADEVTFGVNGIFYAREWVSTTYYVVEDTSVMRENLRRSTDSRPGKFSHRCIATCTTVATHFQPQPGLLRASVAQRRRSRFSVGAAQRVRRPVGHVRELAARVPYRFTSVVLIGVDFDYVIPDDAERNGKLLTSGAIPTASPQLLWCRQDRKDPRLDRVHRITNSLVRCSSCGRRS